MSEQKYESQVHTASASADAMYRALSNFNNLERVRHLIPEDKVKDMEYDEDMVRFKVDGLGQKIAIRIVDREPNATIKYGLDNVPVNGNFWIQLKEIAPEKTAFKLTIKVELPLMFKMMLDKKLKEGIEQAAIMLSQMPFQQW